MSLNFNELIQYGKAFTGLTPDLEVHLKAIAPVITPHLNSITDSFYNQLMIIPNTTTYLNGRVDKLKAAHLQWLNTLFSADINAAFAEAMYKVGDVHVKVKLPVEFMVGSMTLINNELIVLIFRLFADDAEKYTKSLVAISAITGLSLMIMQQSYQESSLIEQERLLTQEREKFLSISGMSRTLFTNLANAYN